MAVTGGKPSILVGEDDPVIAMDVTTTLEGRGCRVLGPVGEVSRAIGLLKGNKPDAAIVTLQLRDGPVWPLLRELSDHEIPFILTSGHSPREVPGAFTPAAFIEKPYMPEDLTDALRQIGLLEPSKTSTLPPAKAGAKSMRKRP